MSNHVSALCQRRLVGSATQKAVLMYMADKASDDGSGIWTSKANIAADTELTTRAVQKAIKCMELAGIVQATGQRPVANGYTVEYAIDLDTVERMQSTREPRSPLNHVHPTPEPRSPKPSLNHPLTTPEPSAPKRAGEVLIEILGEELAADLIAHRRAVGAPVSLASAKMMAEQLEQCADPAKVVKLAIANGWKKLPIEQADKKKPEPKPEHDFAAMQAAAIKGGQYVKHLLNRPAVIRTILTRGLCTAAEIKAAGLPIPADLEEATH